MNDFDLLAVADLRPDVELARLDQLAGARSQLTAVIAAERSSHPGGEPAATGGRGARIFAPHGPAHERTRRWRAAGAIAGLAVAAGVAVALIVVNTTGPAPAPGPHHDHPVQLTVEQWLASAASAVGSQRAPVPRPGQYIYTVIGQPDATNNEGAWLSADGRKAAFFGQAGGHGGHVEVPPCPVPAAERKGCELDAGYLPQMPASPHALAKFLVKVGIATTYSGPPNRSKNWAANTLGKAVLTMFQSMELSPHQRAGLFRLMAQTHGFFLVKRAVNASGQAGTGIAWTYQGGTVTLIFDSRSYAFLGWTMGSAKGGHPVDRVSLILQEIVNHPPKFK